MTMILSAKLLAAAVASALGAVGAAVYYLASSDLPRVPASVVAPVRTAAPVLADIQDTNPTGDFFFRYLFLGGDPSSRRAEMLRVDRNLRVAGWTMRPDAIGFYGYHGNYEVVVEPYAWLRQKEGPYLFQELGLKPTVRGGARVVVIFMPPASH